MFDLKRAKDRIWLRSVQRNVLRETIDHALKNPLPIGLQDDFPISFDRHQFLSEDALADVLEEYSADEIAHFICQIVRGEVV